jgi:large subunit ribosomal protein L20
MHGLAKAQVQMNRKMLAELAVSDPKAFSEVVALAKQHLAA